MIALAHPGIPPSAVAYHDRLAATWNERYAAGGFRRRAAFFEAQILPKLTTASRVWLDVGCGSGYFSRLLASRGARVTGLDGSAAMIEAARNLSRGAARRPPDYVLVPTVEALPWPDGGAHGCLCLSVLEYLADPAGCLAEMARVVTPGGTVVTSTPDSRSPVRRFQAQRRKRGAAQPGGADYLDVSRHAWTPAELDRLAAGCGLVRQASAGFDPVLPRQLWRLLPPSLEFVVWAKAPAVRGRARP